MNTTLQSDQSFRNRDALLERDDLLDQAPLRQERLITETTDRPLVGTERPLLDRPLVGTEAQFDRSAKIATSMPTEIVQERPVVEQIEEKVFIEKRTINNIQEIHEQPILEIHEQPIVRNIQEAPEIKRFVNPTVLREEVNQPEQFMLPARNNVIERKQETYVANVTAPPIMKEVLRREVLRVVEQPIIKEIHSKPIIEIYEQPIVRIVYEKPVIRTVRAVERVEGVAMTSMPTDIIEERRPLIAETTTTVVQQGPASKVPSATNLTSGPLPATTQSPLGTNLSSTQASSSVGNRGFSTSAPFTGQSASTHGISTGNPLAATSATSGGAASSTPFSGTATGSRAVL